MVIDLYFNCSQRLEKIDEKQITISDVKKKYNDILEKLFLKIIESTKDRKFKVNSEMMNLLGCSKENFYKLMTYMNYKKDKAVDTYVFKGEKKKKEKILRFDKKENPFNKLLSLNIK